MKLCYTEGCTVTNLTIDSKNYNDINLSIEQKRDILHKLIDKIKECNDIDYKIIELIQLIGKYKYLYHCEECGDSVCEWTIKI